MEKIQMNTEDMPLITIPTRRRTIFFIILYCLFTIDFITRVGINAIFPLIQADLQLSDVQVGMMGSIVLFGMAVFVLPVSFLGEKYSPKKAINLSAFVWTIGTILSGMASNFSLLLVSRFLVGTGNAAYAPLSNSLITSMYSKKDWGKKIGIYNTAMALGMALGAVMFANLAAQFGWRMAFYIAGIISLFLVAASLILPDSKKLLIKQCKEEGQAEKNKATEVNIKEMLQVIGKNKALLGICLGAGLVSMSVQGVFAWLSIYFVREMGMNISMAASLIGISSMVCALSYPISGIIMDKWYQYDKRSRVFLPAISLSVGVISFLVGFHFKLVVVIFLGLFVTTIADTSYHVATQELVPSWFKSVSYGVFVLFIQLLGAGGPLLAGFLSTSFGLVSSLLIIQVLTAIAAIIFLLTSRIYVKSFEQARKIESEAGIC